MDFYENIWRHPEKKSGPGYPCLYFRFGRQALPGFHRNTRSTIFYSGCEDSILPIVFWLCDICYQVRQGTTHIFAGKLYMEVIGYLASIVMGLTLGLVGGGGSILTVPILVYLFDVDPVLSTAYSLFVVGLTSMVGSLSHFKNGHVHVKTAVIFGLPSIVAVYSVRKFVMPIIPDPVFTVGSADVSKSLALLVLFAVLMLVASITMIRKPRQQKEEPNEISYNYPLIFIEGIVVGGITGLVGAGGGFLIIPALVLLAGLPMKQAVGTSLLIIAFKSLIGFTGDLGGNLVIDYKFMFIFSAFAIAGILSGSYLSKFVSNEKLKPAFGWFVLAMGLYILVKELLF